MNDKLILHFHFIQPCLFKFFKFNKKIELTVNEIKGLIMHSCEK